MSHPHHIRPEAAYDSVVAELRHRAATYQGLAAVSSTATNRARAEGLAEAVEVLTGLLGPALSALSATGQPI